VRQSWDQGSLRKVIDVIGKTGRNWPIHAGKDQIHLISASIKSTGTATDDAESEEDSYTRSRGNSQNATRDPHASLALFTPRQKTVVSDSLPAVVPQRASARPPQRDYRDLFAGNDSDQSPASPEKPADEEVPSPAKPAFVSAKAGAGRNYAPSRLFETDVVEEAPAPPAAKDHSAEHQYRANPAKYKHFEFGDDNDPQDGYQPVPHGAGKKNKHGSQWDFADFATPAKAGPGKIGRNDVVHWGTENDEVADSPIKQKHVYKPRKDAETNIEFQDDGPPQGENRATHRNRGAGQNNGLGLYKNNVYDEEQRGEAGDENIRRLDTISNVKDRSKDFDPHFSMTDDSPAAKPASGLLNQKENLPIATSKPTAAPVSKDPLGESTNMASQHSDKSKITAGDGMGGTRGANRSWGIGDDSDGDEVGSKRPSKYKAGRNQPSQGDFWNF
jgi:hypothetical protein